MVSKRPGERYAWLESTAARRASDLALGVILLVAAVGAFLGTRGLADSWTREARLFPSLLAGLTSAVGALLLARGTLGRAPQRRMSEWQFHLLLMLVLAYCALVIPSAWRLEVGHPLLSLPLNSFLFDRLLSLGPADYAASLVLIAAIAVALARLSRLRAAGMVLLGMLLATVGRHLETDAVRLTMGLEALEDGISLGLVETGLVWVAEGMVGLVSPALLLATYTRRVRGWRDPAVPVVVAAGRRILAALVIAVACYLAVTGPEGAWNAGLVLLFGLVGVACKSLAWSRPALLIGVAFGALLEEKIRQALVISRGHFDTFVYRPLSVSLLAATGVILVLAMALSLWRRAAAPAGA